MKVTHYHLLKFFLMALVLFFWKTRVCAAEIPQKFTYQGRLLDKTTLKPVSGTLVRNFKVVIRSVSDSDPAHFLLEREIRNVVIQDGNFFLEIDVTPKPGELTLWFDETYIVEVLMGDSAKGGKIGQQFLISKPFAMASRNTLRLGGLLPSAYALSSHGHETPGTSAFVIDGSKETKGSDTQFQIRSNYGLSSENRAVFQVDEDANLKSVQNLRATSVITSNTGFYLTRLFNSQTRTPVLMNLQGDLTAMDDLYRGTISVQGSLKTSGNLFYPKFSTLSTTMPTDFGFVRVGGTLNVAEILQFKQGASVEVLGTLNPVGISHKLEDHVVDDNSTMKMRMTSLVSGSVVDNSFHKHELSTGQISFFQDQAIQARHIPDDSLINEDFGNSSAAFLIEDKKLDTIKTPGKIALGALPVQLVLTSVNNDFTSAAVVPLSVNDFDTLKSKHLTIASTVNDGIVGAFNLLRFTETAGVVAKFDYTLKSSGDLELKALQNSLFTTAIRLESPGDRTKTYLKTTNLQFADLDGNPSADFFTGSMIADKSVTTEDFANNTLDTRTFSDATVSDETKGVKDINFSPLSITGVKLAGELSANVFSDSAPFGAAVSTTEFADAAITSGKLANSAITAAKIANLTLTTGKFANGAITSAKIRDGTLISADFSGTSAELLKESVFQSKTLTSRVFSTGTGRIQVGKFADEVFKSRTQPMRISTAATGILTLSKSGFTKMLVMQSLDFENQDTHRDALGIFTSNGEKIIGINTNGAMMMSFTTSGGGLIPVTVSASFFAPYFRLSDKNGNCGNGDSDMIALYKQDQYRSECISKNKNHGTGIALDFISATQFCQSRGYGLCSISSYLNACSKSKLGALETLMSSDLLTTDNVAMFDNTGNQSCSDATQFHITSLASTTTHDFRCCYQQ